MGLKTNNSLVDVRLSKMEAAIENIASLEREVAMIVTTKATSGKEPKWTIVMANNVCQVVSRTVKTLVDALK
jgi:hypothetical protein